MIKFGPKSQLTAIVDNWAPYYIQRAKDVLDGTWKSTDTWGGLKSKLVVMAPYTNMPDDVKAMAMKTEAAIKAGTLHPFKCPIIDQDGKTVECKGGDSSRRCADPEHELLRQGHRRQDTREVTSSRSSTGDRDAVGDHVVKAQYVAGLALRFKAACHTPAGNSTYA